MPIYEYECLDCGKRSEFLVGVVEGEVKLQCGHCGSERLEKVFSQFAGSRGSAGSTKGKTCCGRAERCETPPCHAHGNDGACVR
jgi:putative FmdB family regulatory protein